MDEIPKYTSDGLKVELFLVKEELYKANEENVELKNYIHEINQECLELHASVFEEANKMVQDALCKQSEVEMSLQNYAAENIQLRIQLQMLTDNVLSKCSDLGERQRNKSKTSKSRDKVKKPENDYLTSIDSGIYKDFLSWLLSGAPIMSPLALHRGEVSIFPFLTVIIEEDVIPCLRFNSSQITQRLLRSFPSMEFSIKLLPLNRLNVAESCPLVSNKLCKYELIFKDINETSTIYKTVVHISRFAKNRIYAVCAFYHYVNSLCEDAHSLSISQRHQVFSDLQQLRCQMSLARLGFDVNTQQNFLEPMEDL